MKVWIGREGEWEAIVVPRRGPHGENLVGDHNETREARLDDLFRWLDGIPQLKQAWFQALGHTCTHLQTGIVFYIHVYYTTNNI